MTPKPVLFAALVLALAAFGPCAAQAAPADYPQRPIRMIVPFPPGGSVDILARLFGARLAASMGQQVIVDNRGGGAGNIAAQSLAQANPDGYCTPTAWTS